MARHTVSSHTRRTKSGGRAKVNRHGRRSKGRRPAGRHLRARRALRNLSKAYKAARRSRKGTAAVYATLGVAELGAWVTLRGVAVIATSVGLAVLGIAFVAGRASGGGTKW
jgi:hypothetical protein